MENSQHRINSGFGATSTANEVLAGIDLTGKAALVTGGSSGIGVETTKALSRAGRRSSCRLAGWREPRRYWPG